MSPYGFWNGWANVFAVLGSSGPGQLNDLSVDNYSNGAVRPVVSLKSSVLVTGGNGTGASPYTLIL